MQSFNRAAAIGATTARLPLREHVPNVNNGRLPLTLPAVFEMLLHVHATGDWKAAIELALPSREYIRPPEMSKAARRAAKRKLASSAAGDRSTNSDDLSATQVSDDISTRALSFAKVPASEDHILDE